MPEAEPMSRQDELEELLREIDIEMARIPLILQVADFTLERSQIIWKRIQNDIDKDSPKLEEARRTLRIAGLLRD